MSTPMVRIVREPSRVVLIDCGMFLTPDEAVHLANELTDAVDELEAVSGE